MMAGPPAICRAHPEVRGAACSKNFLNSYREEPAEYQRRQHHPSSIIIIIHHHPKHDFEGVRSRNPTNISMRRLKKNVTLTDSSTVENLHRTIEVRLTWSELVCPQKSRPRPHYRGMTHPSLESAPRSTILTIYNTALEHTE